MASGRDSAKTQLMQIYKLEFYKHKNKWKLYEDKPTKELPLSPETTNKLNKTYNVGEEISEYDGEQVSSHNKAFLNEEPEYDGEQVSSHNKAFLNEELEDTPDPQPPDDAPPSPVPEHSLFRPHSWSGQPYSGDRTEPLWQDAQQEWCGVEPEVILEELPAELAYDQCDGVFHQHNLWAPAADLSLKPAVDPLDRAAQNLTNEEMVSTAENWLLRHGYPLLQEDYACSYDGHGLPDESDDFVRGAHAAPHSSEIELNITQECPCTGKDALCMLTVRQLAGAIQRHHYALSRLLWEQAIRDGLSASCRPQTLLPFEECPTRDTDPLRVPDGVLSGSHRIVSGPFSAQPLPAAGRGRGRLHQARQLIGVAMGRPYLI